MTDVEGRITAYFATGGTWNPEMANHRAVSELLHDARAELIRVRLAANIPVRINPKHEAADAFWAYWHENGEAHKHGFYESTWGAINAALLAAGISK